MFEIRTLNRKELRESIELSEFAFQYKLSPEEIEKRMNQTNEKDVWGCFQEGNLASKLMLLPLEVFIGGKPFQMGGIAGVATWPEYRRKGMVRALLERSLYEMKKRGQTVSMLHPFQFDFYRRFGWETFVAYKRYTIGIEHLRSFPSGNGNIVRLRKRDIPLLNGIYEKAAKHYNGMLKRTTEWWRNRVFEEDDLTVVHVDENGDATGYLIYHVKEQLLKVNEMMVLDEQTRLALIGFMKDHDSMAKEVTMVVPEGDQLSFLLDNPRIKQEITPYFMARIVDVEEFLTRYPFQTADGDKSLFLHIDDDFAEWNNGTYHLTFREQGGAEVKVYRNKKEGAACAHPPKRGISCSVQTLAALLFGYQSVPFLKGSGRLHGKAEELDLLQSRIPDIPSYLSDFF